MLHHVLEAGLIDPSEIFIDGTHIKAAANNHKYKNVVVDQKAKFMSEQLDVEINLDRKKHAKKFLKPAKKGEAKSKKQSTTDPDSGWFHKGEHKEALAYTVEAGNIHDSQAFPVLFAKLEPFSPEFIIADSGYKTPSIAKFLLEKEITPVFPYTRPRVREAFYVLKTLSMTSILTAIFVQRTRY